MFSNHNYHFCGSNEYPKSIFRAEIRKLMYSSSILMECVLSSLPEQEHIWGSERFISILISVLFSHCTHVIADLHTGRWARVDTDTSSR